MRCNVELAVPNAQCNACGVHCIEGMHSVQTTNVQCADTPTSGEEIMGLKSIMWNPIPRLLNQIKQEMHASISHGAPPAARTTLCQNTNWGCFCTLWGCFVPHLGMFF